MVELPRVTIKIGLSDSRSRRKTSYSVCWLRRFVSSLCIGIVLLAACRSDLSTPASRDSETLDRIEAEAAQQAIVAANTPAVRNAADAQSLIELPIPTERPDLSSEDWNEITNRGPYATEAAPDPLDRKGSSEPNTGVDLKEYGHFVSAFAWVVIIILLLGLLGYGIRYFQRKPDTSVTKRNYSATDELLSTSQGELASQLSLHLVAKNYQLAIRYRFGQVLQSLRARKLLIWVPGSTNAEYGARLPPELQLDFAGLAARFDKAMYSGQDVSQGEHEGFDRLVSSFAVLAQLEDLLKSESPSALGSFAFPQNPSA